MGRSEGGMENGYSPCSSVTESVCGVNLDEIGPSGNAELAKR